MSDAFVAVDTGLCLIECHLMRRCSALVLLKVVHVAEVVAIAAFLAVIALHPRPFMLRHLSPFGLELLWRVNCSQNLVQQLVARLNLANHFWAPFPGHMAIWAGRPYTGSILIMDGVAIFDEDVFFHLMARNTKGLLIGPFQYSVKATPKNDAAKKSTNQNQERCRLDKEFCPLPERWMFHLFLICRRHLANP